MIKLMLNLQLIFNAKIVQNHLTFQINFIPYTQLALHLKIYNFCQCERVLYRLVIKHNSVKII
jgi:hypothetical protein